MNWFQVLSLFVIWVGVGFALRRKNDMIRETLLLRKRNFLIVTGIVGFIASAVILFFALALASQSPSLYASGQLTFLGYLLVAIAGTLFVCIQVISAASMIVIVLQGVTSSRDQTSTIQTTFSNAHESDEVSDSSDSSEDKFNL